jgi:hypothetical protein
MDQKNNSDTRTLFRQRCPHSRALCHRLGSLARAHEKSHSVYKDVPDDEAVGRLLAVDLEIGVIRMLKGLQVIYDERKYGGNMILQFSSGGLTIHEVGSDQDATTEYFRLEKAIISLANLKNSEYRSSPRSNFG